MSKRNEAKERKEFVAAALEQYDKLYGLEDLFYEFMTFKRDQILDEIGDHIKDKVVNYNNRRWTVCSVYFAGDGGDIYAELKREKKIIDVPVCDLF